MNARSKKLLHLIVSNDNLWNFINTTIIPFSRLAEEARRKSISKKLHQIWLPRISPDMKVLNGPFKGMKYENTNSYGSPIFPKILGCYEIEIQSIIETVCLTNYSEIINIGCAEGYYAIGLAIRLPMTRIIAFDSNNEALQQCYRMALLNHVEDRVIINGFCDKETLKQLKLGRRALVLCDCEGYEKQLFDEESAHLFENHDLLIEIHDGTDIQISSFIKNLFIHTHEIETITVINDYKRTNLFSDAILENMDSETKFLMISENRLNSTEWFFIKKCRKS